VRDREPDLGQTQYGTELTSAAHEVSCHSPMTVQVTGRLSDDRLDQLVAQVVQAVTERIAAADRELTAHTGGHARVVATAATAAAPAESSNGWAISEAGERVLEDEFGRAWYLDDSGTIITDDDGNTFFWKAASGSWEHAAGPADAYRVFPWSVSKSDLREAEIQAAVRQIDPAAEQSAVGRLAGLDSLYANIKLTEAFDDAPEPPGGWGPGEKSAYSPEWEEADELGKAHFATVQDFDQAALVFRMVVERRAVALTLLTLRDSEHVLQGELARYYSSVECDNLATEIATFRFPPDPAQLLHLMTAYPILKDSTAFRGAVETKNPALLGELLTASAKAQLDNITKLRGELQDHRDVVFEFDDIINMTLTQLGVAPDSVQAQIIRDRRGEPGPFWARKLLDDLLLALSFASGPLGWAARAIMLAKTIRDIAATQHHESLLLAAAHAGQPLASPLAPSWHAGELFSFFAAALSVPGAPEERALAQEAETLLSEVEQIPGLSPSILPEYASKNAFMDAMRDELLARRRAGNKHVLDFLLDENGEWQKTSFIAKSGRFMRGRYAVPDEIAQILQAGHLQSDSYAKLFGTRMYYMLEDAMSNWESGQTIENLGDLFSSKPAVLIDGIPIDITTARSYEPDLLPAGTVDRAPVIEAPGWNDQ
jgi:hypothetical protein